MRALPLHPGTGHPNLRWLAGAGLLAFALGVAVARLRGWWQPATLADPDETE